MSTPQSIPPVPFTAKALYNFVGNHEDELQFKKGDYVTVLQVVEGGWWEGQLQVPGAAQGTGPIGWFPANHIKIIAVDVQPQPITTQENGATKEFPPQSKNEGSKSSQKVSHYSLGVYSLLESQLKFEEVLNNLLEKSLIPLGNNNILSAKDYDILCCNLHEITQLVKSLTKELTDVCKQPPNQQKFGKQFANFLSRYRNLLLVYCANHPSAVRVISNHRITKSLHHSAQLDNFAKASRSSSGGSSAGASNGASSSAFSGTILDLTAAFSLPFRQIETYSSILRDIRASITENHLDFQHITDAIRMADNLVSELEEIRNMKEKEWEILAARIESWPLNVAAAVGEPQLSPLGPVLLLVSVWVQKNNNQGLLDCYMVMFSDYLVILETTYDPMCYRCQHLIEMHDLVAHAKDVSAPPDQVQLQVPHTSLPLTLIDREGERYQVFFKSNQSRSLWVKSIGEQSALAKAAPLGALTSQAMSGSSLANSSGVGSSSSSKQQQFSNQNRIRAATTSAAISASGVPTPSQSIAAGGSSRTAAPFMRSDRNTPLTSSGRSTTAVTSGGFDITQLRPNPPMTPSELILCSRHSTDSVKSPKVSRKKSNRKSEKIRAEELAEIQNRKTLDCRSLDHDAKIFEVIEAYCQSSQNRMTLHSAGYIPLSTLHEP